MVSGYVFSWSILVGFTLGPRKFWIGKKKIEKLKTNASKYSNGIYLKYSKVMDDQKKALYLHKLQQEKAGKLGILRQKSRSSTLPSRWEIRKHCPVQSAFETPRTLCFFLLWYFFEKKWNFRYLIFQKKWCV